MNEHSLHCVKTKANTAKQRSKTTLELPQSIIKRSRRNSESTATTRRVNFYPWCKPKQRRRNSLLTPTTILQPNAATGVQNLTFTLTPNLNRTPSTVHIIMSTFHEGLDTQTNLDSAMKKTTEVAVKQFKKNIHGGLTKKRCDTEALVRDYCHHQP